VGGERTPIKTPVDERDLELEKVKAERDAYIKKLDEAKLELEKLKEERERLMAEVKRLEEVNRQLSMSVESLQREGSDLKAKLEKPPEVGVKIAPKDLITGIQRSLEEADDRAKTVDRETTFIVSDLKITLKTVLTAEKEEPRFILPVRTGEIKPEEMSTVEISIKPIPGKKAFSSK